MRGKIITGLDIGTGNLKVVVAQKTSNEEPLEILATGATPSLGIHKGVVINTDNVTKSIIEAVNEIKNNFDDRKIEKVFINLNGNHIFAAPSHGVVAVSRADQKISEEDIERVLQAAETVSLPSNKEILHTIPLQYTIDGEGGIKNAVGMSGVRLEVETLLLGGFSPYIKNLEQSVLNSDLDIEDLVISPLAAARACLNTRQKELGVAVLDIGAETSGLAVFIEGELVHLSILPIGSAHITNDIAIGLQSDIDIAERIKLEYGVSSSDWVAKKEIIDISSTFGSSLTFSRKRLAEIIEARLQDIFGWVGKEFKKMPKEMLLPAGVVITGGGANLPKIIDFAKKELKLPCHPGLSQGFVKAVDDPSLSVACGLALWAADLEGDNKRTSSHNKNKGFFKRIVKLFVP